MKNKILTFALTILCTCGSANAQKYRLSYSAYISKNDLKSSKGAKLTSASAILQQDRANYHKFKKRDKGDTNDGGFFATLKGRSSIPALLKRGGMDKSMQKLIQKGGVNLMIELFTDEDTGADYIKVSLVE